MRVIRRIRPLRVQAIRSLVARRKLNLAPVQPRQIPKTSVCLMHAHIMARRRPSAPCPLLRQVSSAAGLPVISQLSPQSHWSEPMIR